MLRMLLPLLLVVVVAALVLVLTRAPGRTPPTAAQDQLGSRAGAIGEARQRVHRAETRYAAGVRSAEDALARARQDVEVLRVGAVVLGRCSVLVEGREHELAEDTRFGFVHEGGVAYRVDEVGDASRIVEDDRRHGRLTVEGDGWLEVVDVLPADFSEAERLVAAGQAATRSVAAARRERTERVERAWAELEEARAATTEVEEARLTLEDLLGAGPRVWDVPEPPEEERGRD